MGLGYKGYFINTVESNGTAIRKYIINRLKEDYTKDRISLKEYLPVYGQQE